MYESGKHKLGIFRKLQENTNMANSRCSCMLRCNAKTVSLENLNVNEKDTHRSLRLMPVVLYVKLMQQLGAS